MAGNIYYPGLVQMVGHWTDQTARVHYCVCWATGATSGGYTSAQLHNLAGIMFLNFANAWGAIGSPSAQLTDCVCTDWSSNTGLQAGAATSAISGSGTGELPLNTAALLSLKVALRYKGGHGRVYLPSLADNITTDGRTIQTAKLGTLQTAVSAWGAQLASISSANGGPFNQVVYLQHRQPKPPTVPPTYLPATVQVVNSITAQQVLATQRRRLRKAPHH